MMFVETHETGNSETHVCTMRVFEKNVETHVMTHVEMMHVQME